MTDNLEQTAPRARSHKKDVLFAIAALFFVLISLEGFFRWRESRAAASLNGENLQFQQDINDLISLLETDSNLHELRGGGSMYLEDPDLIWMLRPNFKGSGRDNFAVVVPDTAPEWSFSINRSGFRGVDFDIERRPGVFRIAALGDSCSFGFGVDQGDSYPEQLNDQLGRLCPACDFEVLNLGVPGYSSRQGLESARQRLHRLSPQAVIISYGTNDWGKRARADDEEIKRLRSFGGRARSLLEKSALFRGIGALLARGKGAGADNAPLTPRVDIENYRKNINKIAQMATGDGAKVILLDMNFYSDYTAGALRQIAAEHPAYILVDAIDLLAKAVKNREAIEKQFPYSANMASFYHRKIIDERPVFLLMVDPVHPNAIGYHIIADELARHIINMSKVRVILNEKVRHTQSLPPLKRWALFKDHAILEKRASQPGN